MTMMMMMMMMMMRRRRRRMMVIFLVGTLLQGPPVPNHTIHYGWDRMVEEHLHDLHMLDADRVVEHGSGNLYT